MNKPFLIVTFSQRTWSTARHRAGLAKWVVCAAICIACSPLSAQDSGARDDSNAKNDSKPSAELKNEPVYPLGVAVSGDEIYVVDLDLPGVWKSGETRELFARGSNLLRKPMNRPRCVIEHPGGGVLVGDSATREIYWIESADAEPKPLTDGHLGIAMAMTLDADGKMLYVGDAEKQSTFRLPIEGGKPELVARVNARGLAFDSEEKLWAVTPDDAAVQRIDVETKEVEEVVTGRPYQYPNGLCWAGDHGYVTDGYGKCIWRFTADGKTEKWHEGEPLVGPVGIAVTESSLFVADPKQKQVYEFNRKSKDARERL